MTPRAGQVCSDHSSTTSLTAPGAYCCVARSSSSPSAARRAHHRPVVTPTCRGAPSAAENLINEGTGRGLPVHPVPMDLEECQVKERARQPAMDAQPPSNAGLMDVHEEASAQVISLALGQALRHSREARGWSRAELVARLPSGIGERTLLSYEHGTRHLTMLRFLEICEVLGVASPELLHQTLQIAQIHLQNLVLRIDLRDLQDDQSDRFRPMSYWARNKLADNPEGVAEIAPGGVLELATLLGCSHRDLANYLARFAPKDLGSEEHAVAAASE